MARMRTLKPAFASSEAIAALTIPCRLHFAMLWTYADDEGRGLDNPRLIKAAIWPLDDDVTYDAVDAWQAELARNGRIVRYEADGRRYFEIANFAEHQRPQKPQESKYPAPAHGVILDASGSGTRTVRDADGTPPAPLPPVVVGVGVDVGVGEPSSSQSDSGTPHLRTGRAACGVVAQRHHDDACETGVVRHKASHLAACERSALTDHLADAQRIAHEHPDWTPAQIADRLMRSSVPLEESRHPVVVAQRMRANEGGEERPASSEAVRAAAARARQGLAS